MSTEHALTFSWYFESHLGPAAYEVWVIEQLTSQGFEVVRRQPSLALSRGDGV